MPVQRSVTLISPAAQVSLEFGLVYFRTTARAEMGDGQVRKRLRKREGAGWPQASFPENSASFLEPDQEIVT